MRSRRVFPSASPARARVSGRRAAPHCPAGHFSPCSDGEKDAFINAFANFHRCKVSAEVAAVSLLPVTIRGEGAGRRMRGGASPERGTPPAAPSTRAPPT
ncbi:hypothetical protein CK220_00235 [Mesorhizobium sp. WSM3860]|nr:hypothetical protein CK220_00235 [Mesorhizobium sp. WSM3860]